MPRRFRRNVGVLGLGIIGRRIADHLRHRGLSVFVWNRTPRPVPNFVGSPGELAQTCNYLQIFVSDDDALMRMIQMMAPSLTAQHIVIVHATVAPDTMREAAAVVQRRGGRLLEAPFTGSKLAAEKGELVYYVGGDDATLAAVRSLLEASSKTILHIGEIGHGSIIKVATNLITAASVQAAAEGMALVHYAGIPLEKFAEAIKHNAANSATLDMKLPRIMSGDFEPHFSVKHMLKDMQIASRVGRDFDLELNIASAARARLLEEARAGRGEQDYSSVARRYLPFVQTPNEQEQPDLFSQAAATAEPEGPDFLEEQMAELESAGVTQRVYEPPPIEPPAIQEEPVHAQPLHYAPLETSEQAEASQQAERQREPEGERELERQAEIESEQEVERQQEMEPEHEAEPEPEPEPILSELQTSKRQAEPQSIEADITLPPREAPKPPPRLIEKAEPVEEKRGFLSRLLGRTADY